MDLDLGDNAEGGVDEEEISLEPCSSVVVLVEVVLVVLEVDKVLKMALSWSWHNQDPARLTWVRSLMSPVNVCYQFSPVPAL